MELYNSSGWLEPAKWWRQEWGQLDNHKRFEEDSANQGLQSRTIRWRRLVNVDDKIFIQTIPWVSKLQRIMLSYTSYLLAKLFFSALVRYTAS